MIIFIILTQITKSIDHPQSLQLLTIRISYTSFSPYTCLGLRGLVMEREEREIRAAETSDESSKVTYRASHSNRVYHITVSLFINILHTFAITNLKMASAKFASVHYDDG